MRRLFKRSLLPLLVTSTLANSVLSYDIVDRSKLVDDRFKTMEITRPIGHDFFINIHGHFASDIMDLQDDADELDKIDDSNTSQAIEDVNNVLEKYYDKEQIIRANIGLGFPLPSFMAFNTRIKPNFRVDAGLFAMLTPQKESLTMTDIIANLDQIPSELRSKLTQCLSPAPNDGDDLIQHCVNQNVISQIEADKIKETYAIDELPYSTTLATTSTDTPLIDIYAKAEVKAGLFNTYKYGKHFFGDFNLYALGRSDIKKRADALLLISGGSETEVAENTLVNMVFDWRFGYKNSNYAAFLGLEEVKLSELSSEEDAELNFGDDMLIRIHGQADYRLKYFKLTPYIGSHARSGYGLGDAYYLGADMGAYVWDDRLGLNLKTQIDKEHLTLGFRAKLWFMHADLTGKFPITDNVDGVEMSTYYGANLRIFF